MVAYESGFGLLVQILAREPEEMQEGFGGGEALKARRGSDVFLFLLILIVILILIPILILISPQRPELSQARGLRINRTEEKELARGEWSLYGSKAAATPAT